MRRLTTTAAVLAALSLCLPAATAGEGEAEGKAPAMTTCKMSYTLSGWSAFYRTAKGEGTITCDNGQTAEVKLRARGGGLTAGKSSIDDGKGTFSKVSDISEVFGAYAEAEAHAGAVKSTGARALTKGEVSLALTGKGRGWDLGVAFGKFVITRK